ncbi:MAG: PEP-utilizing enzyme [Acidimicrobiia bacterium]|nr:PEP-utilizing enzyme [Acidimicrobiia bacterium]
MTFRWVENNPFNRELPVWTRAYAAELLPGPVTPLGWDIVWTTGVNDGWRDAMVDRMGFGPSEISADAPELVGIFGGYAYLNASLLRVWAARTPALAPNHVDTAYFVEHPEMPVYAPAAWHEASESAHGKLTHWLSWVLVDQNQSELEAGRVLSAEARADRPKLAELSDGDVVEHALGLKPLVRALASQHLTQALAASIGPGIIAAICDEVGLPTNATALISGLGEIESVSPTHAMWTLSRMVRASPALAVMFDDGVARLNDRLRSSDEVEVVSFVAGLDALSAEVGFRAVVEWDPCGPTWETDPEVVLGAIDQLRRRPDDADPSHRFAQREAERRALVKEIGEVAAKRPATKEHFDAAVAATDAFVRGRERAKANVSRVVHEIRLALRELGERASARGDVADPDDLQMLFADELEYYADGGLSKVREITDERRAHIEWLRSIVPPFIIKAEPPPVERSPVAPRAGSRNRGSPLGGEVLFGKPGSSGVGRGRARIVLDVDPGVELDTGDVLVATSAPELLTPLFVGAAAVVVEEGGLLSHATIICRELGVPAVVRATGATARIRDGDLVEVDGVTGIVTVVEAADGGLLSPK